ncbi:MAG TPA: response regulator [Anaerolineae bacterium]|nr:response regulator [Anaerolineae bacterium]HQI84223.1 response regulator [Anaerolineae bacterium]
MNSKGTVLVVDDDLLIRSGLQRILSREGYEVEEAESAEAAQKLFPRRFFDLVITDLQMPGQDGLALLRDLKGRSPHTPVVMLTAHGSMDVVVNALRSGASDFLTKPYKPAELLSIVAREVTRHRQSLPPGMEDALGLQLSAEASDAIDDLLLNLRVEINARGVLIIEGNGSVVAAKGAIEDLNISALGALVAGSFAATAGIASLIGEDSAFRLNFHEGEQYSIYSGQIVPGVFLVVIFGQDTRLGAVVYYTKDTLAKLRPLVESAVVKPVTPPVRPAPAEEPAAPAVAPSDAGLAAPPAGPPPEDDQPLELFSFEDLLNSGALEPEVMANLEAQFANLWK